MATTEPWKIPITILSRCQQFKFKQSSSWQLINLLRKLAEHEQIAISENSLALLAKIADGSVRDAENLFDQVIGFCGDSVGDDDVRYVLGIPGNELLHAFLTAFFTHQPPRIFSLMEQLVNQGYNLRFFCMEIMERIRNLIVLKIANQPECYLRLFDYTRTDLERYVLQTTLSELQQLYWLIAEAERAIKFSPNPRFILEMALINMANVQELQSLNDLYAQLQEISASIEPELSGDVGKEQIQELRVVWEDVLNDVQQKRPALAAILKNAIPVQLTQDEFTIGFHQEAEFSKKSLEDLQNISFLSDILKAYLGRTVRIVPTIHNEAVSIETMRKTLDQRIDSLPRPEARPPEYKKSSPSDRHSRTKGNRQKRSSSRAYKPPVQVSVQDLVKLFEGRIEEDV
jgi:DNA polymerase-3 subunit gamma/tau